MKGGIVPDKNIPVVLAIVGSREFGNPNAYSEALTVIVGCIRELRPIRIISGGAEGIDTFAATIGRLQGIEVIEELPRNRRWAPAGYQERNELIAQGCTHLLSIRSSTAKSYGSGWTADYAEKIGRTVYRTTV